MASQNEQAFRRWWWIVVVAFAIGVAGAFVSLQLVKPEYQASCKLFVAGRPDSGTGEGYQAAQFAQARVAAYLELVKGARVAEGAISALGLNIPAEELQARITATAAAESVVMTVSVIDSQAQRSADLANAACTSFVSVAAEAEGVNPLVNVRTVEFANKPNYPIGPSRSRYLTIGALAGVLAGIGLVVVLGRMNRPVNATPVDPITPTTTLSKHTDPTAVANDADDQSAASASHRYRDG